jgi:hypothetical protein
MIIRCVLWNKCDELHCDRKEIHDCKKRGCRPYGPKHCSYMFGIIGVASHCVVVIK